jgi:hypothetical protein
MPAPRGEAHLDWSSFHPHLEAKHWKFALKAEVNSCFSLQKKRWQES